MDGLLSTYTGFFQRCDYAKCKNSDPLASRVAIVRWETRGRDRETPGSFNGFLCFAFLCHHMYAPDPDRLI